MAGLAVSQLPTPNTVTWTPRCFRTSSRRVARPTSPLAWNVSATCAAVRGPFGTNTAGPPPAFAVVAGAAVVADEIKRCADALAALTGSISPWFRPSGIEVPTPLILEEAGKVGYRTSVGYDVDSLDFQDPGAKAVVANVAAKVRNGAIVSVHFGHTNTVEAMPALLDLLASKNLAPVTVGRLLA